MIELIHGDCLEEMSKIKAGSIDMVITSPPYDNLRSYNGNIEEWSESVWKGVFVELYRIIAEGGVVVWVVGDATIKGSETGTSFKQALWAMECGFNLFDTMVWEKASRIPTQDRYYNVIEYMFVFSKNKPKSLNLIADHKNVTAGAKKKKDICINKGNNIKGEKYFITGEYSRRSNIWKYGTRGNGTTHPAIFPIQLAIDHIVSWSDETNIILDPFMGSGTTGVAAYNLKRDFIGIEKDQEYFDIAEMRINEETAQQAMAL